MTNECYLTEYNCRFIDHENDRSLQLGQSVNHSRRIKLYWYTRGVYYLVVAVSPSAVGKATFFSCGLSM